MAVLTDMEGNHNYCSCLNFYEAITGNPKVIPTATGEEDEPDGELITTTNLDGEIGELLNNISGSEETIYYYIPKCLCLISNQKYFNILKVRSINYSNYLVWTILI